MTNQALFCRNCGKALTDDEKSVPGAIFCRACSPAAAAPASPAALPPSPAPPNGASPGLAFLLGLIPGVGAIYNGQYVKGLVHVFIFGLLLSLANMTERAGDDLLQPLLVMMLVAWVPYMAFEAYHTARKRALGFEVDEFSSVVPLRAGNLAGPAALIGLGVLFLLHNLDLLRISQVLRYWPVLLIALGVYLLYSRITAAATANQPESRHDHQ
jgi:hypothetical protein